MSPQSPTPTSETSEEAPLVPLERLWGRREELAAAFAGARPFPHLVIDDLVALDPAVTDAFPDESWPHWQELGDAYQHRKLFCRDIAVIPPPFRRLIEELNRPAFLELLESITGIERLIPDPYLEGGGLHLSGPGGILAPHTDFHLYDRLHLYRRVNLIVYLNPGWERADGGCLVFGEPGGEQPVVVPVFGRGALFATDDRSVHGFPEPVAPGRWRRSVALYYYTADEAPHFSGDATTHWRTHGSHTGVRQARLVAYKGVMKLSRALSLLGHLINPNQGTGLARQRLAERRRERSAKPRR